MKIYSTTVDGATSPDHLIEKLAELQDLVIAAGGDWLSSTNYSYNKRSGGDGAALVDRIYGAAVLLALPAGGNVHTSATQWVSPVPGLDDEQRARVPLPQRQVPCQTGRGANICSEIRHRAGRSFAASPIVRPQSASALPSV